MKKFLTAFATLCEIMGTAFIVPSIASVIERLLQKWGVSNKIALIAGIFLIIVAAVIVIARNYIPDSIEESEEE